jgi:hypothetical protein
MSGQEQNINELKKVRLEKLQELRDMGIDPFGGKYERSAMAQQIIDDFNALEGKSVKIAGRIMSKRRHGKAGFANLQDLSGRVQLYFRKDDLGEEQYELFKKMDIGDILGIEGEVFRTQKGEISIVKVCKGIGMFKVYIKSPRVSLAPTSAKASAMPKRSTAHTIRTFLPLRSIIPSRCTSNMHFLSKVFFKPLPSTMGVFLATRSLLASLMVYLFPAT